MYRGVGSTGNRVTRRSIAVMNRYNEDGLEAAIWRLGHEMRQEWTPHMTWFEHFPSTFPFLTYMYLAKAVLADITREP